MVFRHLASAPERRGTCGEITIGASASGSAKGGEDSPWDIGPGKHGFCGTVIVQDNTISGTYDFTTYSLCTFTVYAQVMSYTVIAQNLTITCNGETYGVFKEDLHGIRIGETVRSSLPAGTNLSLTLTADVAYFYGGGAIIIPFGIFSATIDNVTITAGSMNDLGMVTLVLVEEFDWS